MTLASRLAVAVALTGLAACARPEPRSHEPSTTSGAALPSWSDGLSKTALTAFVGNDGTLSQLPPRERLQDLHRLGRGRGVHAAWVEHVYGIPPEQVIGSRSKMKHEMRGSTPVLARLAEIDLIDDKAGKPVGIQQVIGRRLTIAFGDSDGDFEMLEWTTRASGPRLGVIVHHTDARREWA